MSIGFILTPPSDVGASFDPRMVEPFQIGRSKGGRGLDLQNRVTIRSQCWSHAVALAGLRLVQSRRDPCPPDAAPEHPVRSRRYSCPAKGAPVLNVHIEQHFLAATVLDSQALTTMDGAAALVVTTADVGKIAFLVTAGLIERLRESLVRAERFLHEECA